MKAEDTVMSQEQLEQVEWGHTEGLRLRRSQAQAKISFEAGIREVVEWIKRHSSIKQDSDEAGYLSWFVRDEFLAKLKEWEID